jgi:putative PIN family toxin of toxin-antitoxin system
VRIILDTNVVVSGILFGGSSRELLQLWFDGEFDVVCSPDILEEYKEVLERFGQKRHRELISELLPMLLERIIVIECHSKETYSRDKDDDMFVNCAVSGNVHTIVSGDKDLLVLNPIGNIRIVNVRQFLDLF